MLEPKKINDDYNADQISILEGLEAVRKRPGMYIGSTSGEGLHHLLYEILDNGGDEAMAGHCNKIGVDIMEDNSITVSDNGRGIPVDIHPKTGTSTLEVVYTILHAGGKFGNGGYPSAGGLHGVGASVVNALSEHLEVSVTRAGDPVVWGMSFSKGKITVPFGKVGTAGAEEHGTTVHFLPDATIFSETVYDYNVIRERMRDMAFLTRGLTLTLTDHRDGGKSETFAYEGGIAEYVEFLNSGKHALHNDILYLKGEKDKVFAEVSFQYNDSYSENVISYVNNIHTPSGGTHVAGFRTALTKAFNNFAKNNGLFRKKDMSLGADDLKEGLTAIVSVRVPDPEFEGQTKHKLGSSEVRGIVDRIVNEQLTIYLELHPEMGRAVCEKALLAQQARDAARKARESTRRKSAMEANFLPGKLADCSDKNPENCEIYLVEGDSAGGSAKTARNRMIQAILPLRGKILNVYKKSDKQIFDNAEIKSMITAFGTGIGKDFNIDNLRYGKIILMTDADVDGAHITTLLLTFIYKFMPDLIRTGHVYLAKPPLYKLTRGKHDYYAYSDQELAAIQKKLGAGKGKDLIQRYKGLGEMDAEQLWETTMNPETRTLKLVDFPETKEEDVAQLFDVLMGEAVAPRRKYIEDNARFATIDN